MSDATTRVPTQQTYYGVNRLVATDTPKVRQLNRRMTEHRTVANGGLFDLLTVLYAVACSDTLVR